MQGGAKLELFEGEFGLWFASDVLCSLGSCHVRGPLTYPNAAPTLSPQDTAK